MRRFLLLLLEAPELIFRFNGFTVGNGGTVDSGSSVRERDHYDGRRQEAWEQSGGIECTVCK